jgi:aromatase
MGRTSNSVVIAAPLPYVWDALNEIENWPTLFSEYANAEILERRGNYVVFRLTTHPDEEHGGRVWTWVSERTIDPTRYKTSSRRIETGPFQFMNIEWTFEPIEGGTRLRWVQTFAMKPEAPADDAQAEDYLNRNTRVQMETIKARLEAAFVGAPAAK